MDKETQERVDEATKAWNERGRELIDGWDDTPNATGSEDEETEGEDAPERSGTGAKR